MQSVKSTSRRAMVLTAYAYGALAWAMVVDPCHTLDLSLGPIPYTLESLK